MKGHENQYLEVQKYITDTRMLNARNSTVANCHKPKGHPNETVLNTGKIKHF